MRLLLTPSLIAGFGFLVLGCAEDQQASYVSVWDSAGVQVVESSAPHWGQSASWRVSEGPAVDLTLSGSGRFHEFYRVAGALRLPDGRITVADGGSREVRMFSPEGRILWTVGREGDGPGDFRVMGTLSRMRGDSLVVYDARLLRLTILDPMGEVGRIISLGDVLDQAADVSAYSDSLFIGLASSTIDQTPQRESSASRMPLSVVHFGQSESMSDTIAVIGGMEFFRSAFGMGTVPFSKRGHVAVRGSEFVLGTADSLAFDRYRSPGVLVQRVRVPGFGLRLSAEQIDSARQERLPSRDDPDYEMMARFVEAIPIPEFKPGYSKLLLDSEGYVWAAQNHGSVNFDLSVSWEVFSPDGRWMGRIQTPEGLSVFEIGTDYVLGVRRNDLGVESVQLWNLFRS